MPYTWLHSDDLSPNGYDLPDYSDLAFIGWTEYGPDLSLDLRGIQDEGAAFTKAFYYYAPQPGWYVKSALDNASWTVWHDFGIQRFSDSPYYMGFYVGSSYCKMKLYGDGTVMPVPTIFSGGGNTPI